MRSLAHPDASKTTGYQNVVVCYRSCPDSCGSTSLAPLAYMALASAPLLLAPLAYMALASAPLAAMALASAPLASMGFASAPLASMAFASASLDYLIPAPIAHAWIVWLLSSIFCSNSKTHPFGCYILTL